VWRYNPEQNVYTQVKTIQNQLLSIQKYLDSTKYIQQAGTVVDCSDPNNWENIYLANYSNVCRNEEFMTVRKELMDNELLNKK
jgi:hypothetical protein